MYVAVGLLLLLVVYPLSTGPAIVLMFRVNNETFTGTIGAFYFTLGIATEATGTQELRGRK